MRVLQTPVPILAWRRAAPGPELGFGGGRADRGAGLRLLHRPEAGAATVREAPGCPATDEWPAGTGPGASALTPPRPLPAAGAPRPPGARRGRGRRRRRCAGSLSAESLCRRRGAARGGRAGRAAGRSASAGGLRAREPRPPAPPRAGRPPQPPCPRAAVRLAAPRRAPPVAGLRLLRAGAGGQPLSPVNVTIRHLKANSAVVSWDVLEDEVVTGFAISQQKKDVRMLRFIQEVNTTTRSCALWDLEEDTEYIVHVQAISIQGQSPASEPVLFKTPREAEKMASKNKDEVTMKEMGRNQQLRTGEVLIIVVVLFMWAGVIALFCRQYDIIKDNEPNNNKEKAKSASETSTPEHQGGGLLRSKFPNKPSVNIIEA